MGLDEEFPTETDRKRACGEGRRWVFGRWSGGGCENKAQQHKAHENRADSTAQSRGSVDERAQRRRRFHGQRRTNETHASITDPEARLYRKGKGKEAKL